MTADALLSLLQRGLDHPWVQALLVLVVGLGVVRALSTLAHRRVSAGSSPHWAMVARLLVNYGGAIVVLLTCARVLQIDLTALIATAGVATIAIGFAAQTSLGNLIAGLFLLIDRPFQVGDTVEMEGRLGIVQEITLLSTLVRTFDSILVRWPNEVVLKSTILNYTRYPARRVDLRVGIAYGSDIERARSSLRTAIQALDEVLVEPSSEVVARSFLDSAIELEVRAWVPQSQFLAGRTAVIETVQETLAAEGIAIPFPQVTVWNGGALQPPAPAEHREQSDADR